MPSPGTDRKRIIAGYEWTDVCQWLADGSLVDVADAVFHVLDGETGNPVADWSVASGHIVIASKTMTLTVPAAETQALAAQKRRSLRYVYEMTASGGQPQPMLADVLVIQ